MSKVFLSDDGRHVIKKIKPKLGRVKVLDRRLRARLARRNVELMDVLRAEGAPIPRAAVPAGHPDVIVQEFVSRGAPFESLSLGARPRALAGVLAHVVRAMRAAWRHGHRSALIDPNIGNFRFDRRGRVTAWFDPVGIDGPWQWILRRVQLLRAAGKAVDQRSLPSR